MIDYTEQERIEILKRAKALMTKYDGNYFCMCPAITSASEYKIKGEEVCDYFPELLEYKPWYRNRHKMWFRGSRTAKRLNILTKVIQEIKSNIKFEDMLREKYNNSLK